VQRESTVLFVAVATACCIPFPVTDSPPLRPVFVKAGTWIVVDHSDAWGVVCDGDRSGGMWETILSSLGGDYQALACLPDDAVAKFLLESGPAL
jgi:hypothetical protein